MLESNRLSRRRFIAAGAAAAAALGLSRSPVEAKGNEKLKTLELEVKSKPSIQRQMEILTSPEKGICQPDITKDEQITFYRSVYTFLHPFLRNAFPVANVEMVIKNKFGNKQYSAQGYHKHLKLYMEPADMELYSMTLKVESMLSGIDNSLFDKTEDGSILSAWYATMLARNMQSIGINPSTIDERRVKSFYNQIQSERDSANDLPIWGKETVVITSDFTDKDGSHTFFKNKLGQELEKDPINTKVKVLRGSTKTNIGEAIQNISSDGTIYIESHTVNNAVLIAKAEQTDEPDPSKLLSPYELLEMFKLRYKKKELIEKDNNSHLKLIFSECDGRVITNFLRLWRSEPSLRGIFPPIVVIEAEVGSYTYGDNNQYGSNTIEQLYLQIPNTGPRRIPTIGGLLASIQKYAHSLPAKPMVFWSTQASVLQIGESEPDNSVVPV